MTKPLLRLHQIGRRFGGLHAVADVSLDIPVGARHAIIGANGAGKTTLLRLVSGTLRPSSGRILLTDRDITALSEVRRARLGMARTWQHPAVYLRLTPLDHLTLAAVRHSVTAARPRLLHRQRISDHALTLLQRAGLAPAARTPAGTLPYGQQRLLELVTVLASQPQVVLLDEPSAGLDTDDLTTITALLRELPTPVTLILVDHDLDLVWALADTVTVLDHGRLLTTDTPTRVRTDPLVQAAYLSGTTQISVDRPRTDSARPTARPPLLRVRDLRAGYAGADVLTKVDLDAHPGQTLAILGRNGAGKTTLLSAIAGLHPPTPPTSISLADTQIRLGRPQQTARYGLILTPQGRRLFDGLTVAEHLRVATPPARLHRRSPTQPWTVARVLQLFPALADRLSHTTRQLSGGEQQMLAIARALMTNPRVLLLDEPSEGLSTAVINQLGATLAALTGAGMAVVLAEQHLPLALRLADQIMVLDHGVVTLNRPVPALTPADHQHLRQLLGTVDAEIHQAPAPP